MCKCLTYSVDSRDALLPCPHTAVSLPGPKGGRKQLWVVKVPRCSENRLLIVKSKDMSITPQY